MSDRPIAPPDPQDDFQLGPYRVTGLLARGGMGVVYRGEHIDTGEAVAIKTVRGVSRELLAGIRREIHALRGVQHPGIVRILADGVTEGLPWYAMPLLLGRTLRQELRDLWSRSPAHRPDPVADDTITTTVMDRRRGHPHPVASPGSSATAHPLGPVLALIRRICEPLAFLHGEGLVHRDIKPENVFLQDDGRPVLVDLGIVVHFGGTTGREELDVEQILGTPEYMAPEQFRGELIDARADLYALGCIFYECLTGQPPFTGETAASIRRQHLHDRPLPPSLRTPGLSPALDQLVLQLLEKRPQDRMGYGADLSAALVALGAPAEPESGPPAQLYLYRPEITGRADALAMLAEAVERLTRRRGGLVLIRGESGVGKTRIAMEVTRFAMRCSLTVLTGCGVTFGAGELSAQSGVAPPLHPLRPMLLAIADRVREGGRATGDHLLGPRGKVLANYEPSLLDLPGQAEQPEPPPLPPERARALVIASLKETLWALSEPSPIVLVLDDLQWADELTLSLVEALAGDRLEDRGVLLVGTYRSEESRPELAELIRSPRVTTITLDRLDGPSVGAMVSDMLGLRMPPVNVLDALIGHSNGNPFFVAEYLRAAIGEGMLQRDEGGRWRFDARDNPTAALSSLPLPHTLAEIIERRLRLLDAPGQALLSWAAVLGREMDGELLLLGMTGDGNPAMEALEALRARQLLEEAPGGRLRFVHDKIREIAYERIPPVERITLHRRAREVIEACHPDAPDMAATLGFHCARAGMHPEAGRYFTRAADRARDVFANGDAIRFYRTAIAELTQAPPAGATPGELAALHERLGDVLGLVGRQEEAREAYGAALSMAHAPPHVDPARLHRKSGKTWETQHRHADALDSYALAEAALGSFPRDRTAAWWDEWMQIQNERISVHYWLADVERIRERIDAIRPVVEQNGTALQRARFFHALTQMNIHLERFMASAETVRWARNCLAAFEASGEAHEAQGILAARCSLATILMLHGAFEEAEEQMDASLHAAHRMGDLGMQSRCLTYLTVMQRRRRRVGAAGRLAERSLAVSRAAQMSQYIGAALGNLAWIALERGDFAAAERLGREAISHWESLSLMYPFQWLARLPLLRVEIASDRLEGAIKQARAVLDVRQQRLPHGIAVALQAADAAFAEGHTARSRLFLSQALGTARELGHE